jgi:rod shape-determining protein MreC
MEGRARSRSTGRFLTLTAAMFVIAVLSQQSWAAGFRGAAKSALAPLEAQMTSLASSAEHATAIFGDIASLRAQNQRLTAENQDLKRQLAELNAAAYDNKELRLALDFQRTFGHRTVVAEVVGRGPDAFSRTLQIDRGSDDGVWAGMIVVSGPGLVGRVRESGPHGAIVQTLADPQSRANVFLSGSGLQGTVIGGPAALQLQLQHRVGATASKGEWAITSGIGGVYPRGLVVGNVTSVTHSDAATVDTALVDWVNNLATLSLVIVVLDFTPS